MKLVLRKKAEQWKPIGAGTRMSIDPGLGGTGYAVWSVTKFDELVPPIDSGAIMPTSCWKDWDWIRRMDAMSDLLSLKCQEHRVEEAWMELPAFMEGGSGVGMAAARKGDLVKLVALFGSIAGRCFQTTRSPYCFNALTAKLNPVGVAEWKGQLPKDVCNERVLKRMKKFPGWKPTTKTTHELDAVGIGLWAKGFF